MLQSPWNYQCMICPHHILFYFIDIVGDVSQCYILIQ